jgi:CRP-like cAMP-binding protein
MTMPSFASDTPKSNHLLAALPEVNYQALVPSLESVPLPLGNVLYESGGVQDYVYFPTSSIVSLLFMLENGSSTELAVTGWEGLVGISLFMGGETTPSRAVVQSAGKSFRIRGRALKKQFEMGGALQLLLLRFTQALITQMTQTAVCNRHHSVDQQLCRWLLLSLDRLPTNELVITQELIASMLGVRREGVTEAAGRLQADGVIEHRRGRITVPDRTKLEPRSCECYAVVKNEYDRLLPRGWQTSSPHHNRRRGERRSQ